MIMQISAGQGPEECQFAVGLLYDSLAYEFEGLTLLSCHAAKRENCFHSLMFQAKDGMQELEGTVLWICKSPFRPGHKRKNWYVNVSIIPEKEEVDRTKDFRFERFHCGGKGGQNVNKVETGVRVIHIPTGLYAESTVERSQYQNKRIAVERLEEMLAAREKEEEKKQKGKAWQEHYRIVRGEPVRTYEGMEFVLRAKKEKEENTDVCDGE